VLTGAIDSASQMEGIVTDVLNFAKPIHMEFKKEDVRGIVEQAAAWCKTNANTARISLSMAVRSLDHFCREKEIPAFPIVVVSETLDQGVAAVLRAASVGPIQPNMAMFGWSSEVSRISLFIRQLSLAEEVGMSLVILKSQEPVLTDGMKRIDVLVAESKNQPHDADFGLSA
jgi:hypothetical protein